ncbi:MAG: hypothetical protein AAF645_17640 [Myxococcota bacterium]
MRGFWGQKELLSDPETVRCKGNLLGARKRYILKSFGQGTFDRIADRLEGEAKRAFVSPPMPFAWLPVRVLYAIDEVLVEEAMGGDEEGMLAFGEEIAAADLNAVYRAFFRLGNPAFFLTRAHVIWGQYISGGYVKGEAKGKSARTRIHDVVLARYFCDFGVGGYVAEATRASGGKNVRVVHTKCRHRGDPYCEHTIEWV